MLRAASHRLPLALLLAPLAACASHGVGAVSGNLVQLYDQASPDGVIELEIDRKGIIREMEADVSVTTLPIAVRDAALKEARGARIVGAEREIAQGWNGWEVKLEWQGRDMELVYDDEVNLRQKEVQLLRSEAPGAVLIGADQAIPGGEFLGVERVETGRELEFHVKKLLNGASYKIVLEEDGSLIRKVREARAELEIPLVD